MFLVFCVYSMINGSFCSMYWLLFFVVCDSGETSYLWSFVCGNGKNLLFSVSHGTVALRSIVCK